MTADGRLSHNIPRRTIQREPVTAGASRYCLICQPVRQGGPCTTCRSAVLELNGFMHTSFLTRPLTRFEPVIHFVLCVAGFRTTASNWSDYRMKRLSVSIKCCQRNRRLRLDANVAEQGSACRYVGLVVAVDGRVALLAANGHSRPATRSHTKPRIT